MTRRTFATGLFLLPVLRAEQSESQKRGKELIDRCIQALGGPAFLNMQDRLETGRAYSFYRERLSGLSIARLYSRYVEPPNPAPESYNGMLERQAFGKKQDSAVLFNEDGGFEVTFRGARPLPDDTVNKHRESVLTNFLYIVRQRLREPGIGFEARGIEVVENQRVNAVDVFDNANRTITVYLSADTGLPVRQRYMRFDPMYKEKIEELTHFANFRDAGGGAMWPADIQRERDGEKIYQMFSDSITVSNNFDPNLFQLPSGMKMLKKNS